LRYDSPIKKDGGDESMPNQKKMSSVIIEGKARATKKSDPEQGHMITKHSAQSLIPQILPSMGDLEITSPQPVALLRDCLWRLAVLAKSTPSRFILFEEFIFTPDKIIIIFPFCQTTTLSMVTSVLTTAIIAPALLDLEI